MQKSASERDQWHSSTYDSLQVKCSGREPQWFLVSAPHLEEKDW